MSRGYYASEAVSPHVRTRLFQLGVVGFLVATVVSSRQIQKECLACFLQAGAGAGVLLLILQKNIMNGNSCFLLVTDYTGITGHLRTYMSPDEGGVRSPWTHSESYFCLIQ